MNIGVYLEPFDMSLIKNLHSKLSIQIRFIKEVLYFYRQLAKHNASINTEKNIQKMQYVLLRENHIIEKGMSMRNPKKGFGQAKVYALLQHLDTYVERYSDKDLGFLSYPLSTISSYIAYTQEQGVEIPEIVMQYENLCKMTGYNDRHIAPSAGIKTVTKDEILVVCNSSFSSTLYSRHSIRYFTNEIPAKEVIEQALRLAQQTPSACNRQGWLTHIFLGDVNTRLLYWQGGCRGFEDEIGCSILVTANLNAFLDYEVHQAYIDGGLYAMNLINALHSLGLGTIPLSCGFRCKKLGVLYTQFDIPKNEVPIIIIGTGTLPEKFNVAVSTRKDISRTNTYHK